MSTQQRSNVAARGIISEEAVEHYLGSHPEFFERHPELLARLRLPHNTPGTAISLIERQVTLLRQRNLKTERKLRELVEVARANDSLVEKIHGLAIRLIEAASLAEVVNLVEEVLRQNFGASHSMLVVFSGALDLKDLPELRFVRETARDDAALKPFETFLETRQPRCGQIRDLQSEFLFGPDASEIGSAALIPLGARASLGILAVGSSDRERFHPGMSTDFLKRIGALVGAALLAG